MTVVLLLTILVQTIFIFYLISKNKNYEHQLLLIDIIEKTEKSKTGIKREVYNPAKDATKIGKGLQISQFDFSEEKEANQQF